MRGFGVMFGLLVLAQAARPQTYPRWFLEQGSLGCGTTAVGYANRGFYVDSSASQAVYNARQNLARQRMAVVSGGQAFWATEAGTAWMGGDLNVAYDSSALRSVAADTGAAETYDTGRLILSFVSGGSVDLPDSMKAAVKMPDAEPAWVHTLRNDDSRMHSVGVAPEYFYETSSWAAAERMALLGLAREAGDSVAAIEKATVGSGQQVLSEEVSVVLRDYGIVARWFDEKNRVYYVLMAVEKNKFERRASGSRAGGP